MLISVEEEQKTLKYQETMNVDVEKISDKNNRRPIYEVIDNSFCSNKTFPDRILTPI